VPGGRPVWGAASADLNATILEWPAGEGPPEHANEERDVLYVVIAGSAQFTVDGGLARGELARLVRYLTAHTRRGGLGLKRF
jgi:mannose-6-phosphate isomerase-like protein (cupin superfamily)